MKKHALFLGLALLGSTTLYAQRHLSSWPESTVGQDAYLFNLDGNCVPSNPSNPPAFGFVTPSGVNFGNEIQIPYMDWTWSAYNCNGGTIRSLIRFDELNNIPPRSRIVSATLFLQSVMEPEWGPNSYYPGSTFPTNPGEIRRALVPWNEATVTWANYPLTNTTTANMVAIPPSASQWTWYTNMNVTGLVQDINTLGQNNGFMLKLQNETHYRGVVFASSDHPNSDLRPRIEVEYFNCADFEYCYSSAPNQFVYTLTAQNPNIPGAVYRWYVNGTLAGTGTTITTNLQTVSPTTDPNTQPYTICLQVYDAGSNLLCERCNDVCAANHQASASASSTDFRACISTSRPNIIQVAALSTPPAGYTHQIAHYYGAPNPILYNASSAQFTTNIYPAGSSVQLRLMQGAVITAQTAMNVCRFDNPYREANNTAEGQGTGSGHGTSMMITPDRIGALKVDVWPNPSSGNWQVRLNNAVGGPGMVRLLDVTGRELFSRPESFTEGFNSLDISSETLPPGVYLLEIRQGGSSVKEKLMKVQ